MWILVCGFWAVDFSVDFAMNFAVETYVDSGVEHDSEPCSSCASENLGGFWLWIFFKREHFIKKSTSEIHFGFHTLPVSSAADCPGWLPRGLPERAA